MQSAPLCRICTGGRNADTSRFPRLARRDRMTAPWAMHPSARGLDPEAEPDGARRGDHPRQPGDRVRGAAAGQQPGDRRQLARPQRARSRGRRQCGRELAANVRPGRAAAVRRRDAARARQGRPRQQQPDDPPSRSRPDQDRLPDLSERGGDRGGAARPAVPLGAAGRGRADIHARGALPAQWRGRLLFDPGRDGAPRRARPDRRAVERGACRRRRGRSRPVRQPVAADHQGPAARRGQFVRQGARRGADAADGEGGAARGAGDDHRSHAHARGGSRLLRLRAAAAGRRARVAVSLGGRPPRAGFRGRRSLPALRARVHARRHGAPRLVQAAAADPARVRAGTADRAGAAADDAAADDRRHRVGQRGRDGRDSVRGFGGGLGRGARRAVRDRGGRRAGARAQRGRCRSARAGPADHGRAQAIPRCGRGLHARRSGRCAAAGRARGADDRHRGLRDRAGHSRTARRKTVVRAREAPPQSDVSARRYFKDLLANTAAVDGGMRLPTRRRAPGPGRRARSRRRPRSTT